MFTFPVLLETLAVAVILLMAVVFLATQLRKLLQDSVSARPCAGKRCSCHSKLKGS